MKFLFHSSMASMTYWIEKKILPTLSWNEYEIVLDRNIFRCIKIITLYFNTLSKLNEDDPYPRVLSNSDYDHFVSEYGI